MPIQHKSGKKFTQDWVSLGFLHQTMLLGKEPSSRQTTVREQGLRRKGLNKFDERTYYSKGVFFAALLMRN
jgi:hypothetical protein